MTIKNYSRNILQKTKKGTTNKSDEVGHHPTSLHFLPPLGVNFTIHQGPSLRNKKGVVGKVRKLERSYSDQIEELSALLFIVSEVDDYKKKRNRQPLSRNVGGKRRGWW